MPKKLLLLLPATLGPILLLTGAWRAPVPPPAPPAAPLFLAQPIALSPEIVGAGATGTQLLDRALARLAPLRRGWLHTKIWQKMNDGKVEFEAEGTLDLAPGQCARLDLSVRTPAAEGRMLTISDGHALAQVLQLPGEAPRIISQLLPLGAKVEKGDTPERLRFLAEKGCGGPLPLLEGLRRHGREFRLQTGMLQGQPVIHLRGALSDEAGATPARQVQLYLDAQTLWPRRLEWWGAAAPQAVIVMEFREPVCERELPLDECARLFTYEPPPGP